VTRQEATLLAYMYSLPSADAVAYWKSSANEPHRGDCSLAEHQGPITCDRCVTEEVRERLRFAKKILSR
jgi:hypothetical protein